MNDCPLCKLNEQRDFAYLKEYTNWHVRISKAQHKLGATVISSKRHIERFADLNQAEVLELLEIQSELEEALYKAFSPARFNYVQLGNVTRHLHIHLIPRYLNPVTFAEKEWSDEEFVKTPGLAPVLNSEKESEETLVKIINSVLKYP